MNTSLMSLAPIALFVYNRPGHLKRMIELLKANHLAKDSELFIFSDAAKDESSKQDVRAVRDYLKTIQGFKNVKVHEHENNLGPSNSIIKGVTDIVDRYGKVIVLEDDLAVAQYFLDFMNEALFFYENQPRVISICGYMYPVRITGRETLFLRMTDCWGWATWKRGWDLFSPDADELLARLKARKLSKRFNLDGGYDFLRMLKRQSRNRLSSWAVRWYACALLNDNLSLYPAVSLVKNIGLDNSGANQSGGSGYDTVISRKRVQVFRIPLKEDSHTLNKIIMFFKLARFKKLRQIICNNAAALFRRK